MLVSSSWDGEVVKWEFTGNGEVPAPPPPPPPANRRLQRRYFTE